MAGMDTARRRQIVSELSKLQTAELDSLVEEVRNRGNAEAAGVAAFAALLARRNPFVTDDEEDDE
jgi:hypothetical protein